jgi:guanidinopropionase
MNDPAAFQPLSGMVLPRFAGIATFMRLPHLPPDAPGVQIGLIGLPWDGGTTNRPGARHGPRALRDASTLMRRVNPATGITPYDLARCADLGDVACNPVDLADTLATVEAFYAALHARGVVPLSAGGDHLLSLPVLRGIARGRPLGMVHVDAHSDTADRYFNDNRYVHGTPFRRAIEEGLLDPARVVQIGIRGTLYEADELAWALGQGVRVIRMAEVEALGIAATLAEARRVIGAGPAYLSFDIDSLDPVHAPGTGTPEIGGLTSREALALLRGLRGVDFVGADLVEVSPPFDVAGLTAIAGASLLWEILCLLAERVAARSHV